MDVEIKQIIDELNNSPRFGRPEFGKTVVITDLMAKKIARILGERTQLKLKKPKTVGAIPQ